MSVDIYYTLILNKMKRSIFFVLAVISIVTFRNEISDSSSVGNGIAYGSKVGNGIEDSSNVGNGIESFIDKVTV